jgi:hypothetical protein
MVTRAMRRANRKDSRTSRRSSSRPTRANDANLFASLGLADARCRTPNPVRLLGVLREWNMFMSLFQNCMALRFSEVNGAQLLTTKGEVRLAVLGAYAAVRAATFVQAAVYGGDR